jgi:membrane-associated progesterone receptor component
MHRVYTYLHLAKQDRIFNILINDYHVYQTGGPYSNFAGHDASRGLSTFSLGPEAIKDEYDDLSDLNSMQMDSLKEWETQFLEKYDLIGRYLKPGEKHQQYEESETEEEDGKGDKKDN